MLIILFVMMILLRGCEIGNSFVVILYLIRFIFTEQNRTIVSTLKLLCANVVTLTSNEPVFQQNYTPKIISTPSQNLI